MTPFTPAEIGDLLPPEGAPTRPTVFETVDAGITGDLVSLSEAVITEPSDDARILIYAAIRCLAEAGELLAMAEQAAGATPVSTGELPRPRGGAA